MPLLSSGVDDEDGGRPLSSVSLSEALELVRLIANVDAHRDEVLIHEFDDAWIGVDLGIQPSATASHRRRAEVQQHMLSLSARRLQRGFQIRAPGDRGFLAGHCISPTAGSSVFRCTRARLAQGEFDLSDLSNSS